MLGRGLFALPPSRADVAVAKWCARMADPPVERSLRVATWLADEKVVLAAAAMFWLYARLEKPEEEAPREADRMLCAVVIASALPHLAKLLVARERPNRVISHRRNSGIPKSGKAWDSFPSGHAAHLGAIAGSLRLLLPRRYGVFVWPSLVALAGTRVALLAHYVTDVIAGLGFGVLIDRVVSRFVRKT
jgi:membrane-associated phospholipid phosphatase